MALPQLLTRDDIQSGLIHASEQCHQPDAGLFGPGSICWQLMRENLSSLAQGRSLLLALSDSRLSQLLGDSNDVVQRFHHTQVFLLKLIFGNLDQALLTLDSPRMRRKTLFDVDDSEALLYALTAWMDSCLMVYQEVIEPLNSAHQERLFEETMLLARVLGIPEDRLPAHWHAHRRWWNRRLQHHGPISDRRRRLGNQMIREEGYPGRLPYGAYLPLASFQLPEHLRQTFRLPQTGLDSHRAYQRHLNRLMELTRKLPARLRYQPAYHEASQRLSGRARADLATRLLNRWWTGESDLVNSGWSIPKVDRLPSVSY
ncbi:MAG: oxygenase MpaB family protein [Pseudomonadota bacterium]|nr:oxygenase MpaB family protein [Pseudomonadota bacterium]